MEVAEKIGLFRSLFRGRDDVYAVRWENYGRSGYKPVRAPFRPEVIECHLLGEKVVGVYPLLLNNKTHFLAIDCDGALAARDSQALVKQCRVRDLPAYLERSRSGQGFHLWFFFTAPITAEKARAFGTHIVKSAGIELQSLDRFFPSQDYHTGPKGLGNLIALPLQKRARDAQNSVFVDPVSLQAPRDQWSLLKNVRRLSEEELDLVLSEPSDVLYAPLPLLKLPQTAPSELDSPGPVKVKLTEHIEVSLPCSAALLSFLRSVSQFSNPEWFRKTKQGQFLGDTPRFIRCGGRVGDIWVLARGLWGKLQDFLEEEKITYDLEDKRVSPATLSGWSNSYDLRPDQLELVLRVLSCGKDVVLEAPTGTGKTVIGLELLVRRAVPALIIVPSKALLEQWLERVETGLGIEETQVGRVQRGKLTLGEKVNIATFQSLFHLENLEELANHCGHVIVDECHRVPAKTFTAVIRQLKPQHYLGLTATPRRKDQLQKLIFAYLGELMKSNTPRELDRRAIIVLPDLVYHRTDFEHQGDGKTPFQTLLGDVSRDAARNQRIADDVVRCVEEGHLVLVLSERKEQCDLLHDILKEKVGVAIIYGRVGKKARKNIFTEFEGGAVQVLISTARLLGEGWDCPPLSALFLASPMGDSPRLEQFIGRLTRPAPDKPGPVVHDYRDHRVPVLARMFESRLKIYRRLLGDERIPSELQSKPQKEYRAELQCKPVKRRAKPKADRVEETGQLYLF